MSQRPCNSFATATYDPSRCKVCSNRFMDHIKSVREAWWRSAPDAIIDILKLRLKFLEQTSPERCTHWNPISAGEDIKVCTCGRIRTEHNLRVIVQGEAVRKATIKRSPPIKATEAPEERIHPSYGLYVPTTNQCSAYRKLEPGTAVYCRKLADHTRKGDHIHEHEGPRIRLSWMNSTSVELGEPFTVRRTASSSCDGFRPIVELPGYCRFCGYSYIEHSDTARGLELEDISNIHSPTCASIVKTGLNRCSCMQDSVKQMMLDSIGDVRRRAATKSDPTVCTKFTPASVAMSDLCSCGRRFYQHSLEACDGFSTWARWRSAHMSNAEVIKWFLNLGTDDVSRMREFKRRMDKPNDLDPTAPPPEVIRRISQMLPARFHNVLKVTPRVDRTLCFKCAAPLIKGELALCEDCQTDALGPNWVPKLFPPAAPKLATEANINNNWEDGAGYDSKFD